MQGRLPQAQCACRAMPHPRVREDLIRMEEYEKLHRQLIMAFYDQVEETIDAGVAL